MSYKTLKSLFALSLPGAVLALALTACSSDTNYDFDNPPRTVVPAAPVFDPAAGKIPSTNDLLFSGSTDGTLNIPGGDTNPVIRALNTLDGFSSIAPITASFTTPLDPSSTVLGETVHVYEATKASIGGPITSIVRELTSAELDVRATGDDGMTLAISPLQPLSPSTTYLIVLTNGLKDSAGEHLASPSAYLLAKGEESLVGGSFEALEPLRQLVNAQETVIDAAGVAKSSVILSWFATVQSMTPAPQDLIDNPAPSTITATDMGFTTNTVNSAFPGLAEVYTGTLDIPYFISPATAQDPTGPLTGFWTDASGNPLSPLNNTPVPKATLTIPLIMTVPNAASGKTMPASGWPVVIYQHGITRNRTDMLALADTMAQAGYALIAIDLPLHGVADTTNIFHASGSVVEPTFDLDFVNNETGAAGPDGIIDASGTHFINLQSLLTSRDNMRQGVINLLTLRNSLASLSILDANRVGFIAHSLGGIVGATYLGVEDTQTPTSLVTTGGGVARLLDGSETYGPVIRDGLAAQGVTGADYEAFLIAAQTVIDPADPVNYAMAATQTHPIHMIEVVGDGTADNPPDQVIPNLVPPLSGTEPLAALMGLPSISTTTATGHGIVRFTQGEHGSLLTPSKDGGDNADLLNVFMEMHSEVAAFQASNGAQIVISDDSVIMP